MTNKTMEAISHHVISMRRRQSGRSSRPRLIAEWQSGPEINSSCAQWKLRLVLVRPPLEADAVVQDFLKCPAANPGDKSVNATDKNAIAGDLAEKRLLELAAGFVGTNCSAFRYDHPQAGPLRFDVARDLLRRPLFAVISRPIRLSKGAAPIRRVLIFDDHPATIRLLENFDPALDRTNNRALVVFCAVMVLLVFAVFWPLF